MSMCGWVAGGRSDEARSEDGEDDEKAGTSHSPNIHHMASLCPKARMEARMQQWLRHMDWTGERNLTATTVLPVHRRGAEGRGALRKGRPSMRGYGKLPCTSDAWPKLWRTEKTYLGGAEQGVPEEKTAVGRYEAARRQLRSGQKVTTWRHPGHRGLQVRPENGLQSQRRSDRQQTAIWGKKVKQRTRPKAILD